MTKRKTPGTLISPRYEIGLEKATEYYELYKSGKSLQALKEIIGVGSWAIKDAFRRFGFPLRTKREIALILVKQGKLYGNRVKGEGSRNWKGGRTIDNWGYVYVMRPDYHRANAKGYVREHIMVWEEYHKKILPKEWHIHHINGVKTDNRIENLLAIPSKEHKLIIPDLEKKIKELEDENRFLREKLAALERESV